MKTATMLLAVCCCTFMSCKKEVLNADKTQSINDADIFAISLPPPEQTEVYYNVDYNIGGYLELLPAGYSAYPTQRYPLLIFLDGNGEYGNGTTDLHKLTNVALPKLIQEGRFPASFIIGGQTFSFIVLTPQFKTTASTLQITNMLNYAIKTYRVDTTRVYLSGLSNGAGLLWYYAAIRGERIAAIAPISGTAIPDAVKAMGIVNRKVAVWGFHNRKDVRVLPYHTTEWVYMMKSDKAQPLPRLTLFNQGGHDAWTQATDPLYKENNMNIYEWMLKHKRTF